MEHNRPPRVAIIAIMIALAIAAYYAIRALSATGNGELKASGAIEAVMIDIAPEIGGRVSLVHAAEGEAVAAGKPLVVLDDSLLREQRKVAAAAVESGRAASRTAETALDIAKAQYQQALEIALAQGKGTRLDDWFAKDQVEFDQPQWYFSRGEQMNAMQVQIDEAQQAWDAAQADLETISHSVGKTEFLAAEQRVLAARIAYLVWKDVDQRAQNSTDEQAPQGRFNRTHCGSNEGYSLADRSLVNILYACTGDEHLSEVSQRRRDNAREELDAAQLAYNELLTTAAADEVLTARAEVAVAQERYYAALDRLSKLQTSDFAPAVTAAQGAVEQAQAAYDQSLQAVSQAQAALDLVDAQIRKLTLIAPIDGVIVTRAVEPGEFFPAGAVAMRIGDLGDLTITVFVPEDRYGQIRRGQTATVRVDSFPDLSFAAHVTRIADEAEFTPRNVQTVEGRSATVYAIELSVLDPDGLLRPGMPADVTFDQ